MGSEEANRQDRARGLDSRELRAIVSAVSPRRVGGYSRGTVSGRTAGVLVWEVQAAYADPLVDSWLVSVWVMRREGEARGGCFVHMADIGCALSTLEAEALEDVPSETRIAMRPIERSEIPIDVRGIGSVIALHGDVRDAIDRGDVDAAREAKAALWEHVRTIRVDRGRVRDAGGAQ